MSERARLQTRCRELKAANRLPQGARCNASTEELRKLISAAEAPRIVPLAIPRSVLPENPQELPNDLVRMIAIYTLPGPTVSVLTLSASLAGTVYNVNGALWREKSRFITRGLVHAQELIQDYRYYYWARNSEHRGRLARISLDTLSINLSEAIDISYAAPAEDLRGKHCYVSNRETTAVIISPGNRNIMVPHRIRQIVAQSGIDLVTVVTERGTVSTYNITDGAIHDYLTPGEVVKICAGSDMMMLSRSGELWSVPAARPSDSPVIPQRIPAESAAIDIYPRAPPFPIDRDGLLLIPRRSPAVPILKSPARDGQEIGMEGYPLNIPRSLRVIDGCNVRTHRRYEPIGFFLYVTGPVRTWPDDKQNRKLNDAIAGIASEFQAIIPGADALWLIV